MRWRGQRQSQNIEDRRGQGGRGAFRFPFPGGGRGGGMRFPSSGGGGGGKKGGIGIIGILIILGLIFFFGGDLGSLMQGAGPTGGSGSGFPDIRLPQQQQPFPGSTNTPAPGQTGQIGRPQSTSEDDLKGFVAVVLGTTEDVWHKIFRQLGGQYREPRLVLFEGSVRSACGTGMSAMGPFYCPADEKVYIDLDFYRELRERFQAPGDFAQAYVIAHEVGHHVQNLLGIIDKVESAKRRIGGRGKNSLQVRMELQADCFAGLWANQMQADQGLIEPGDIDEALQAASAIGDDRIQRQTQGYVVPESFTHGSSEQRERWFRRGYEGGQLKSCDTFNTDQL